MFKKVLSLFLSAVVFVGAFCACSDNKKDEASGAYYTFNDSEGNTVTLDSKPQNVAVLLSSLADLWQIAGGETSITVGESVQRGFCPDTVTLVDDSAGKTINSESLIAAQPDFVIGSADIDAQKKACELARQAGIPSAVIKIESFEDYLNILKIFTDITGNSDSYKKNGTDKQERINKLVTAVKEQQSPNILFIRAGSKYSSTKAKNTKDNFTCQMFSELGCINIADSTPILLDGLSVEYILKENPKYIFISTMGKESAAKEYIEELFKNPEWQKLDAVKNGDYTFLPKDLFHYKPNDEWDKAYEYLINILYPEIDTNGIK